MLLVAIYVAHISPVLNNILYFCFYKGIVGLGNKKGNTNVESNMKKDDPIKISSEAENKDVGEDGDDDDKEDDNDDGDDEASTSLKGQASDMSKEELALRIYNTITSTILPQLHKCVTKKVSSM